MYIIKLMKMIAKAVVPVTINKAFIKVRNWEFGSAITGLVMYFMSYLMSGGFK